MIYPNGPTVYSRHAIFLSAVRLISEIQLFTLLIKP